MLVPALPPHGRPSHAYLLHGPAGVGKRTIARGFAAALLADGARDASAVAERIARDAHPDLTWVTPSGASEMLVSDIEEPVVAAAARTPFESTRRVFVIEGVETMNDQAANRMLKTLEEPPAFVHLLLLSDRRQDVLETIASRCQCVRFDPLPVARIAASLEGMGGIEGTDGVEGVGGGVGVERVEDGGGLEHAVRVRPERAHACARLAQGDARLAARLASAAGGELRARAESFARAALAGETGGRPWMDLLEAAKAAGTDAGEASQERVASELEFVPSKERKRYEREGLDARRRGERRARTSTLDLELGLAELWLRDVMCVCEGAPELIYAVDRRAELEQDAQDQAQGQGQAQGGDAQGRNGARLRKAIELVGETRLSLALNVSEELALEALAYRVA